MGGMIKTITAKEFAGFQEYIYAQAGIFLSPVKEALLVGRLSRRLRRLELQTFADYLAFVKEHADERRQMLDAICTNETHFFREPAHFDFVARAVLPRWIDEGASGVRRQKVRIWSAGCSTGEEPYSIAMLLLDKLGPSWTVEIVATDLSTKVLDAARAATWSTNKAHEIPADYLKEYMLRGMGPQEGKMRARQELSRLIQFQQVNLNDDRYPVSGKFDLIFCRNVMIYFDVSSRKRITSKLLAHLDADGYLFVGHAESLANVTDSVVSAAPTIYRLR